MSEESKNVDHLFVYSNAKAGMDKIDKKKIDKVIYEASKGSEYFKNEQRKAEQTQQKMILIKKQLKQISMNQLNILKNKCIKELNKMEQNIDYSRTWIHIDMDCFYAAVAMRDNPSLVGKPIAVGGMSMISTTNYIARKYGVRAAMPGFIGKKLCKDLIFVKHDWNGYVTAAEKVRNIISHYDPEYTTASLDEAYLDVTNYIDNHSGITGEIIAKEIRDKIFQETKLTASAGISCNRMLAKICSDMNKPNGQYLLKSNKDDVNQFMKTLNIRKIPGIGKVTQRILNEIECKTCSDVIEKAAYVKIFFKDTTANWILKSCLGISTNKRDKNDIYFRKSLSKERTFRDESNENKLIDICKNVTKMVSDECKNKNIRGKTITLKIKTNKFEVKTRAHSLNYYTNDYNVLITHSINLLKHEMPVTLRLLGIKISSLEQTEPETKSQPQLDSFFKNNNNINHKKRKMDDIKSEDMEQPKKKKRKIMLLSNKPSKEPNIEMDSIPNNNNNYRNSESPLLHDIFRNHFEQQSRKSVNTDKMERDVDELELFDLEEKKDVVLDDIPSNDLNIKMDFDVEMKEKKIVYACPVCGGIFKSNLLLNNHLDFCLNGKNNKKRDSNQKRKSKLKSKSKSKKSKKQINRLTKYFKRAN